MDSIKIFLYVYSYHGTSFLLKMSSASFKATERLRTIKVYLSSKRDSQMREVSSSRTISLPLKTMLNKWQREFNPILNYLIPYPAIYSKSLSHILFSLNS